MNPTRSAIGPARTSGWALWRARWHAARVVQRRDTRVMLLGPGLYVAVALGMLAVALLIRDHLDAIAANHLLVLSDAFGLPFSIAAIVVMLFLAITSATAIARERDQGTLEVLFYGPIDPAAYVLGKHLGQLVAYLPASMAMGGLVVAFGAISGLRLGGAFPVDLVLSVFAAAATIAFGIFLSTLTTGTRSAFLLLIGVFAAFLAIHVGSQLLSNLTVQDNVSPLLYLRDLALTLDTLVGYVSPFTTFQTGADAALRGDLLAVLGALALLVVQTLVLLTAAVSSLGRKGVRR
jgi:ABC-type transport system involved in multi-copper enzyme maturation permease subunit